MIGSLSAASARLLLCCGAHARRVCKCFGVTTRHLTPPHMSSHEPTCRKACEGGGLYSPTWCHPSFRTSETHSHMSNRFPGMGELDQHRHTHPMMEWCSSSFLAFETTCAVVQWSIESEPSPTTIYFRYGLTFTLVLPQLLQLNTHMYADREQSGALATQDSKVYMS